MRRNSYAGLEACVEVIKSSWDTFLEYRLTLNFSFNKLMAGSSHAAVLVLMCGLPAAGKTTLVKKLAARGSTSTRLYERISFDDMYKQISDGAGAESCEFDPNKWKSCQQEMVVRVRERIKQHNTISTSESTQQLVLVVDDNFQYRSLRKRFFHLATDLSCAFAILYVSVPAFICRERNAARTENRAHVPDKVFRRMESVFESPSSLQETWETTTREVSGTEDDTSLSDLMNSLIIQAEREVEKRCLRHKISEKVNAERRRNQLETQRNIHHLVDLQLRQWISTQLRDESYLPHGLTKAQYAFQLNQRRKSYLAYIKSLHSCAQVETEKTAENVAVLLVRQFQEQEWWRRTFETT